MCSLGIKESTAPRTASAGTRIRTGIPQRLQIAAEGFYHKESDDTVWASCDQAILKRWRPAWWARSEALPREGGRV